MILPLHSTLPPDCTRLLTLASRHPRRAVKLAGRLAESVPADLDAPTLACVWYTLAWIWLCWERVPEAWAWLERAQSAWTVLDDPVMLRQCRYARLVSQQIQGSGADLQAEWHDLAKDYAQTGDRLTAARCHCEQIAHLNVLGRPRDALALCEQIAPVVQPIGSPTDQARLAHVHGVALGNIGDLAGAIQYLDQAHTLYTQLKRPVDAAKSLFERAWVWQRTEQFALARADLEQAAAIFQRHDLPLRIGLCQKDLGLLASRQGDFATALAATVQARSLFTALNRRDQLAHCDMHLGIIAYYSGLYELALAAYRRAQEVYADLGNQQLFLVSQRNQAMVACAQNQPAVALQILHTLEEPVRLLGDPLELAEVLTITARATYNLGQTARAMQDMQAAQQQFLCAGNQAAAAECLLEQGWMMLDQGNLTAAEASFQAADRQLHDRPIHRWRVLYGLGCIAQQRGDPAAALAAFVDASRLITMMRRQLASEYASSGLFTQAQHLFLEALRLAADQQDALAVLLLAEEQRALVLQRQRITAAWRINPALQARYDEQRATLGALLGQNPSADRLDAAMLDYIDLLMQARHSMPSGDDAAGEAVDIDIQQVRASLNAAYPHGWSILSSVVCHDELLLITLDTDSIHLTRVPYDAEMQRLLAWTCERRYRVFTYLDLPLLRGQTDTAWKALAELGQRLLPPYLRQQLHPAFRLFLIPGGMLHSLPWCALRVEDSWLCQHAILQYLPGLSFWQVSASIHPSNQAALLIGCNTFNGRAPDLPHALPSLDLVQAHWHGLVTRLDNRQATRDTLLAMLQAQDAQAYRLIHIASHARLVAARGVFAHVKLVDDDLFLDDIMRLTLDGALVVLVACEGALGDILPGDEVLSLSYAFLAAGASGVIASLWQIYDHVILDLLEPFYAALSQGADPAIAITRAQRHMLARSQHAPATSAALYSPLVWASFRYTALSTISPTPSWINYPPTPPFAAE